MKFKKLWDRPGFLVRRLHQIHVSLFLSESSDLKLTPVQYGVLDILFSEKTGLDQVTLASNLGIDRTNVADVLARLEKNKLVTRKVSSEDRRMKLACLTKKGIEITIKGQGRMQKAQEKLLMPLTKSEQAIWLELSQKILEQNNSSGRTEFRSFHKDNGSLVSG